MTEREQLPQTLDYEPVDRQPLYLVGPWADTLVRWHQEGLPAERDADARHASLGLEPLPLRSVSGHMGPWPPFEARTLWEDGHVRVYTDE